MVTYVDLTRARTASERPRAAPLHFLSAADGRALPRARHVAVRSIMREGRAGLAAGRPTHARVRAAARPRERSSRAARLRAAAPGDATRSAPRESLYYSKPLYLEPLELLRLIEPSYVSGVVSLALKSLPAC